jgi:hypothetical protein
MEKLKGHSFFSGLTPMPPPRRTFKCSSSSSSSTSSSSSNRGSGGGSVDADRVSDHEGGEGEGGSTGASPHGAQHSVQPKSGKSKKPGKVRDKTAPAPPTPATADWELIAQKGARPSFIPVIAFATDTRNFSQTFTG